MFKVGDKVRILEGAELIGEDHKIGDTLVVEYVYTDGSHGVDAALSKGEDRFFYTNEELELVKEMKFKVGDKVVKSANVTDSADDHGAGWTTAYKQFLRGDVCEVVEKVDKSCDYIIKAPNGNTFGVYEENLKLYDSFEDFVLNHKNNLKVNANSDVVHKPSHYQLLPEYEVKDVLKAVLDKIEQSDFDMSLYQAGWYQQAMQYFLRFYAKGGLEDLEKGVKTMQFVIEDMEKGENK